MNPEQNNNVVLFPKTVEYYQIQLTRLLEGERYQEAYQLLNFLLKCRLEDEQTVKEWSELHKWLKETVGSIREEHPGEEMEESEADMLRFRVKDKTSKDSDYGQKLLAILKGEDSPEKKLLALEQLAFVEQPGVEETLIQWMKQNAHNPILRFKALQALKIRGMTGNVTLRFGDDAYEFQVEQTPLNHDEFPGPVHQVARRVREATEVYDPTLAYFAEQFWYQFVVFIYGTDIYEALARADSRECSVWACALHLAIMRHTPTQSNPSEGDVCSLYGVEPSHRLMMEQYLQTLQSYLCP